MPKLDMEMTLENLYKSRSSIFEMMSNPYCDHLMFDSLTRRLEKTQKKIEQLEAKNLKV